MPLPDNPNQNPLPSQTLTPNVPGAGPGQKLNSKPSFMKIGLAISLVLAIIFAIVALVFVNRASVNDAKLKAQYESGLKEGQAQQRSTDQSDFFNQQNAEFRTWKAPDSAGAFEIGFPKAWSFYIFADSGDVISGWANPDQIDVTGDKRYGLRFGLKNTSFDKVKATYDQKMKTAKNHITLANVQVSGIDAVQYTGILDTSRDAPAASIVLVKVRDRTFYIQTDRYDGYKDVFAKIVASTKVFP